MRRPLHRRTRNATVGAEHAAMTGKRTKYGAAGRAFVEADARIRRHGLLALRTADRTSENGPQNGAGRDAHWRLVCGLTHWVTGPRRRAKRGGASPVHRRVGRRNGGGCAHCGRRARRATLFRSARSGHRSILWIRAALLTLMSRAMRLKKPRRISGQPRPRKTSTASGQRRRTSATFMSPVISSIVASWRSGPPHSKACSDARREAGCMHDGRANRLRRLIGRRQRRVPDGTGKATAA